MKYKKLLFLQVLSLVFVPAVVFGVGYYTVQRGDTLSDIANGFNVLTDDLVQVNSIENPDLIYPGQNIEIPDMVGATIMNTRQGGTGVGSVPSFGQVLMGDGTGAYSVVNTSSLGITGGIGVEVDPVWTSEKSAYLTTTTASSTYLRIGNETDPIWSASSTTLSVSNFATNTISQWTNDSGFITSYATTAPHGGSGEIQFNNNNVFDSTSSLFWNNTNGRLSINSNSPGTVAGLFVTTSDSIAGYFSNGRANVTLADNSAGQYSIKANSAIYTAGNMYVAAGQGLSTLTFAGDLLFMNGATGAMWLKGTTQLFGVGTSTPNAKLTVTGTSTYPIVNFASSSNQSVFYIPQSGYIGIGTTSPVSMISIYNQSVSTTAPGGITFNADVNLYRLAENTLSTDDTFNAASFNVGSVTLIDSNRRIYALSGASATAPSLTFNGNSKTGLFDIASGVLAFTTTGTERMRITGNGLIGINTTNPLYRLTIAGDLAVTGTIRVGDSMDSGTYGQFLMSTGTSTQWGTPTLSLYTLTRGNGLTGSDYNGTGPTTWAVAYGASANTAVEGNTAFSFGAGAGLVGGSSGSLGNGISVTYAVSFSGTGSANTVARSDHTHSQYATGGFSVLAGETFAIGDSVALIASGSVVTSTYNVQTATNTNVNYGIIANWFGQTFTTPANASSITKITWWSQYASSRDYGLHIRATSGGLPTGADLNTVQTTTKAVAGQVIYNLSTPISVTSNTKYAFMINANTTNNSVSHQSGDPYTSGDRVTSTNSGTSWATTTGDLYFIIDYAYETGKAYKATCALNNDLCNNFVGFASTAADYGNALSVNSGPTDSDLVGLLFGKTYYLADTAGTVSSTAGTNSRKIGTAVSSSTLLLKWDNP